mmetsp:Transcript_24319/g.61154  ORF Transcript_24319/g.61154 Transcript_24319/m.61154 type:complete len:183 (-) Transcript_24319:297-845(-)
MLEPRWTSMPGVTHAMACRLRILRAIPKRMVVCTIPSPISTCHFDSVSGRHNQFEAPTGSQWSLSKSFDTFSSVQPEITLSTQISDPHALSLRTMLNGQVVQEGNTSDLIFKLPEIIAYLSRSTTLLPGTLIMTGTPPGPGHFRSPPVYLTPGDTVTVEIEGLGSLTHKVIAHDDPRAAGAI